MRMIVGIVMILFVMPSSYAYMNSYNVTGYDQYGCMITGTAYTDFESRYVYGKITDENGNDLHFDGLWMTDKEISGYTHEGTAIDLSLY